MKKGGFSCLTFCCWPSLYYPEARQIFLNQFNERRLAMFRPSPMLDFQFNPSAQLHAAICRQNHFIPPEVHARKDMNQVDYEFSNSRKTFANIPESSGLKPINRIGVMTDYEEGLREYPPMLRQTKPEMIYPTRDSSSSLIIREESPRLTMITERKEEKSVREKVLERYLFLT